MEKLAALELMEKLDYQDQQDKRDHQEHEVSEVLQELQVDQELLDLREVPVNKGDVVLQEPKVQVGHRVHLDPKDQSVTKDDKERQVQPVPKVREV